MLDVLLMSTQNICFLSINEEHYRRFMYLKYPSLTSLLQIVTKHCSTKATSNVGLRSGHF